MGVGHFTAQLQQVAFFRLHDAHERAHVIHQRFAALEVDLRCVGLGSLFLARLNRRASIGEQLFGRIFQLIQIALLGRIVRHLLADESNLLRDRATLLQ